MQVSVTIEAFQDTSHNSARDVVRIGGLESLRGIYTQFSEHDPLTTITRRVGDDDAANMIHYVLQHMDRRLSRRMYVSTIKDCDDTLELWVKAAEPQVNPEDELWLSDVSQSVKDYYNC